MRTREWVTVVAVLGGVLSLVVPPASADQPAGDGRIVVRFTELAGIPRDQLDGWVVTVDDAGAPDGVGSESPANQSDGSMVFSGLAPGRYKMHLGGEGHGQWYPSAAAPSRASVITVDEHQTVELSMAFRETGTLRGMIFTRSGARRTGEVTVYDEDGNEAAVLGTELAHSESEPLAPGRYRVSYGVTHFEGQEWVGGTSLASSGTVTVRPGQTTVLKLHQRHRELKSDREPRVRGTVRVGRTVTSTAVHWSGRHGEIYAYPIWFVDGRVVGQTADSLYVITGEDVGKRVQVCATAVTVNKEYPRGWRCSRPSARVRP